MRLLHTQKILKFFKREMFLLSTLCQNDLNYTSILYILNFNYNFRGINLHEARIWLGQNSHFN